MQLDPTEQGPTCGLGIWGTGALSMSACYFKVSGGSVGWVELALYHYFWSHFKNTHFYRCECDGCVDV